MDRSFVFYEYPTASTLQMSDGAGQYVDRGKAVTQMTSLHNGNELAARSTDEPKNSDNLVVGKMMKIMIAKITSLSIKQMIAFTMKPTWKPPFCLIRRPHHLQ